MTAPATGRTMPTSRSRRLTSGVRGCGGGGPSEEGSPEGEWITALGLSACPAVVADLVAIDLLLRRTG
ncbi:hypothetical protein DN585_08425 [Intrasporangium calvum]|nr:hypothetical protein DN585_08425 [Intrasporangium calvum]